MIAMHSKHSLNDFFYRYEAVFPVCVLHNYRNIERCFLPGGGKSGYRAAADTGRHHLRNKITFDRALVIAVVHTLVTDAYFK